MAKVDFAQKAEIAIINARALLETEYFDDAATRLIQAELAAKKTPDPSSLMKEIEEIWSDLLVAEPSFKRWVDPRQAEP